MAHSVADLGCPEHKIQVHHLGVTVDDLLFLPRTWNPASPLRVLIAASFREKKGIPYALEALGRVQRDIPLEITIIGDASREPSSQKEKRKIIETIGKHNLRPKVRMLGYQPHSVLFEEAYNHEVFFAPSVTASDGDTEGGAPVSIIEMVATGMPVVATTHCDIPEVIQHGLTGLLAEERDVEGLIQHLQRLVDYPERWSALAEAGRRYVELEFNAMRQGERLAAIYRELVS
jgi:colanic acid/amylovoran biosynthesis glycosyltransferase